MKFHATLIIERDYYYNRDDWKLYNSNLTEEQFKESIKDRITEDFKRIANRAENVIGDFDYKLNIGKKENE